MIHLGRFVMKKIFLYFAFAFILTAGSFGQTPTPTEGTVDESQLNWQQPSQADGIVLYWSKVPGTDVIAFKGEGIVDAPMDKVATIIADTTRGTEWIDGLVESKVVRPISDTDFIEYDHQGVPFPFDQLISDRDFVSHVHMEADPRVHGLAISYVSVEDPAMPPLKKYVRGELRYCVFKMMPMTMKDQTYVIAEMDCDPEGHLASWLVNFFQEGWPHTTFQNLRQEARKPDIKSFAWVDRLIASTGPFEPKTEEPILAPSKKP
jgi:hypothetical protein